MSYRMRPRNLEEFVGQEHLVGPGKPLRRAIEQDLIPSMIFYGPPGCGKTTLALIIASMTKAHFVRFSAVTSGIPEVRKVIEEARRRRSRFGQKTILFVDEIHRFNRAQQDAFLPHVEDGTIILIGATVENPYFEVNAPLLSRARVYVFEPLREEHLRLIVERALADEERGLGKYPAELEPEAMEALVRGANGDARVALDTLEMAVLTTTPDPDGVRRVKKSAIEEVLQRKVLLYDKSGDQHYDVVSAFVKSMRGSDPDATVYWLARMLYAGEDPRFIARRIIIHASEDVGNADPMALVVAVAAAQAVEHVGLPEAQLALAQAAIYVACAPKSNAVLKAISEAMQDVEEGKNPPVPKHLRDPHYRGARELGHGVGYEYPHDHEGGFVRQVYLPQGLEGRRYYRPTDEGEERRIKERLRKLWGEER